MDSQNSGQTPDAGSGKKKNRKSRNQAVQQNAPNQQQMTDNNVKPGPQQQQKGPGQHSKQHKEDKQMEFTQKQQPVQKEYQSKNTKPQPAQKQDQSKNTKQQPAQKQYQSKNTQQQPAQKQDLSKNRDLGVASDNSSKTACPQIEQEISKLMANLIIPKRKNVQSAGTLGRRTSIDVNQLPLNLDKLFKKTVYHMDVLFEPEVPKKLFRTALEEFNRINYPNVHVAFDGRKNMYTTKELKGKSDVVTVPNDNGKIIDFTITTTVVNVINMGKIQEYIKSGSSNNTPGEAFQALDVALKNRPFALRFTNVGRSFFPIPRITPVDLGEGLELWKGFFQSPVIGWKPFLNVDVANRGFPKHQPLVTYIKEELRCDLNKELDSRSINILAAYIKGLKVDFMVPSQPNTKRSLRVVGLLESAERFQFDLDDLTTGPRKLNVVQYFKTARNYVVLYPRLPCLHVGSVNKKTAIPIELCTVQKGQVQFKKLTEIQTANMVKNTARPPFERRQTIENFVKDVKYNSDNVLKEFGIEVGDRFSSIPARILDQPSLAYFQNKETKPKAGVWRAEKFSRAIQLKKWIVFNLDQRTKLQSVKEFEKVLMHVGRDTNVMVHPMAPWVNCPLERHWQPRDIVKRVLDTLNQVKRENFELAVVIIPDIPLGIYAIVKQTSELQVGILTQCIKSKTMFKMNPSTAGNILLKINSKLNGINHTLSARSSPPCMSNSIIFGADVSHPSADQTFIPSVAAVAASHDIHGSQYNMEWRLQSPKVEIIQDLEDIIHKQLIKFKERTNSVPKKIFYFRDGVSDGQFLQLLEYELVAIRRACMRLNINYRPSVTFLIVQKRHHIRMFPTDRADMDGKFGNVPSGTIIDTQITHPTEVDFYLCSHASIQGTSRPTKYHLIWDDNNLTEDELEQLTFYLCFLFVRCTRSVSYPAPTYYAHLAAFRARTYIENKQINLGRLEAEQSNNQLNPSFTTNFPMFFI